MFTYNSFMYSVFYLCINFIQELVPYQEENMPPTIENYQKFKDTKGLIKNRKLKKDTQYNGKKK